LTDNAKISDVIADTFTNGNATVTIYARIFNPANDSWSDWDFYPNFKNKAASKIQYRNNYVLTTLDGSDFARVNAIRCFYITDKDKISAASQEFITAPQDFYADLKTCYVLVKHSEIVDAEIKCYVLQTPRGEIFENVMIGTATGENQTLYLQSGGVIFPSPSGIHLFKGSNGQPITDFYFDTENSTVSPPPVGDIYASWTAGTGDEVWQEMLQDSADFNSSRFTYRATDSANKKVVAVKIVLTRQGDTVSDTQIGTGTGKLQTFALPHRAKAETLSCTAPFKYDEGGQILKTCAGIAESISVNYDWQASVPEIKEIICGWSV
ncbi:MAG: hypothetical protein IJT73_00585, partial [Selenomonadaceae bacterium]|nr:hypothetical protein [Selenomonadaceae bacterium]